MQSKKTNSKAKENVKKITSFLNDKYKDHSRIFNIVFIISTIVVVFVGAFAIYFLADKPTLRNTDIYKTAKKTKNHIKNQYFMMAEEQYEKGYLENSSIYYKSYINTNPATKDKVFAYQRLFEIEVLQKNYYSALEILDKLQSLDSSLLTVYISRLRLLLRLEAYNDARKEIDIHYPKMHKSVEYKELVSIYFLKLGHYQDALSELSKIPFDKREFDVHKRILQCYIELNQITNALAYIGKIDSKIRTLGMRDYYSEFAIIKAVVYLLKNDIPNAKRELDFGLTNRKYGNLAKRLQVYADILDDRDELVIDVNDESLAILSQDNDFIKNLADYFYYKKNYAKSLSYYEVLDQNSVLKKDEVMAMADLYYKTQSYDKSIEMIRKLYNEYSYTGANYFKNLSANYLMFKNYDQAIYYLREGLDYFAEDVDFYVRLATLYISLGDGNNALNYVSQGKLISNNHYDKRLDILRINALNLLDTQISEVELLALRERDLTNAEYYLRLIEFYIANGKFNDAKREFETVSVLDLDSKQQQTLLVYKLYFAIKLNDEVATNICISEILKTKPETLVGEFNYLVCKMLNYEFDWVINYLSGVDTTTYTNEYKAKVNYLLAVCYYMRRDNNNAYRYARATLANIPSHNKAQYLMTLVSE